MLSRQEGSTTRHLASAQHWTGLAGGDTGRLFLTFGGPVCADRISYCPLDRVLTYKNLIYLLNLQYCKYVIYVHNVNMLKVHMFFQKKKHCALLPLGSLILLGLNSLCLFPSQIIPERE